MANEATFKVSVSYNKDGAELTKEFTWTANITTGKVNYLGNLTVAAAAEAQLTVTPVTSVKALIIQNLDATNYIEVGGATGVRPIKVSPGMPALIETVSGNYWLKANSADVKVNIGVVNA